MAYGQNAPSCDSLIRASWLVVNQHYFYKEAFRLSLMLCINGALILKEDQLVWKSVR